MCKDISDDGYHFIRIHYFVVRHSLFKVPKSVLCNQYYRRVAMLRVHRTRNIVYKLTSSSSCRIFHCPPRFHLKSVSRKTNFGDNATLNSDLSSEDTVGTECATNRLDRIQYTELYRRTQSISRDYITFIIIQILQF